MESAWIGSTAPRALLLNQRSTPLAQPLFELLGTRKNGSVSRHDFASIG
jgi:hypothetical protein